MNKNAWLWGPLRPCPSLVLLMTFGIVVKTADNTELGEIQLQQKARGAFKTMLTPSTQRPPSAGIRGSRSSPQHCPGSTWLYNSAAEKDLDRKKLQAEKRVHVGKNLTVTPGLRGRACQTQHGFSRSSALRRPQSWSPRLQKTPSRPGEQGGARENATRRGSSRQGLAYGEGKPSRGAHAVPPPACRSCRSRPAALPAGPSTPQLRPTGSAPPHTASQPRRPPRSRRAAPGAPTHSAPPLPPGSAGTSCPAPAGGSGRRSRPCCAQRRGGPQPGSAPGTASRRPAAAWGL